MTSCPAEEDLVLFVEDSLDAADAETVAEHLVACAACRRLVARSEAALRYALGGLGDRAAPARPGAGGDGPHATPDAWQPAGGAFVRHRTISPRLAAAAAMLVAVLGIAALAARQWIATDTDPPADVARGTAAPPRRTPTLDQRLDALLARAAALAEAPDPAPDSHAALAALAAAEARGDLGLGTAEARLRDVVERFPGTVEAREARARIAALGGGR